MATPETVTELEPGETLVIEAPEAPAEPTPELASSDVAVIALVSAAENAVETEHLIEAVEEVEQATQTLEERLTWQNETIQRLMTEISDLRNRLDLLIPLEPLAEAITEAETEAEANLTTEPLIQNDTSELIEQTPMEAIGESASNGEAEAPEAEAVAVAVVEAPRRRWI